MKRQTILLAGLLFCVLSGCTQTELDVIIKDETPISGEQLIELQSGVIVEKRGNEYIWEGDILLSFDQIEYLNQPSTRSAAIKLPKQFWPNAKVYYTFEQNFPDYAAVNSAIAHYHANTSIEFIPRTTEKNYVIFRTNRDVNESYLGMIGGGQTIKLQTGVSSGTVIHELGHALGLYHEQSRSDRDQYVTIHWNNIESKKEHNFKTYVERGEQGMDLGTFDFNSIMLYSPSSFAKSPGLLTITKKDNTSYNVNHSYLSEGDKQMIRAIYGPPFLTVKNVITHSENDYTWSMDYEYREGYSQVEFYSDKLLRNKTVLNVPRYIFYTSIIKRKDYGQPETVSKFYNEKLVEGNGEEFVRLGDYKDESLWELGDYKRGIYQYYSLGWENY